MVAQLTAYDMSTSAIKLLINYLCHRQQHVKIVSEFSDCMTILKGVTQGSIIGPCLFNLFLNDIMYISENSSAVNYADDNTLLATGETLMEAVEDVKKDTDENQMHANPVKFQFMHTSKNEDVEFECRNIKIES